MFHNPGGDWHPGWGGRNIHYYLPSYVGIIVNHYKDPY